MRPKKTHSHAMTKRGRAGPRFADTTIRRGLAHLRRETEDREKKRGRPWEGERPRQARGGEKSKTRHEEEPKQCDARRRTTHLRCEVRARPGDKVMCPPGPFLSSAHAPATQSEEQRRGRPICPPTFTLNWRPRQTRRRRVGGGEAPRDACAPRDFRHHRERNQPMRDENGFQGRIREASRGA